MMQMNKEKLPFKIGRKSKYYGREQDLIDMWQKQQMTIEAIARETGVGRRTLKRLLYPLGYESNPGKPLPPKPKIPSTQKALDYIRKRNYVSENLLSLQRRKELSPFMKAETRKAHVRLTTFRETLYKLYPKLKPAQKGSLELTQDQVTKLSGLSKEERDEELDQIAKEKNYNAEYFRRYVLTNYPQITKRVAKVQLTDDEQDKIRHLYLDQVLTVHEIVAYLQKEGIHIQDRNVKDTLVSAEIYGRSHAKRIQRDYYNRRAKISHANTVSPRAKRARLDQLASQAEVPRTYLGQCPDWAWHFVEKQPSLTIVDKLYDFITNRQDILDFLKTAEKHVGHKITFTEISNYLPNIPGIEKWNRSISARFSYDPDFADAKGYHSSSYERKIEAILDSLNVYYQRYTRKIISPYELDFYLPENRLAIEASPLATHNSNSFGNLGFPDGKVKPHDYHQKKMKLCRDKGITLITLFEKTLQEPYWSAITVPALTYQITGQAEQTFSSQDVDITPIKKQGARKFLNKWHFDGYSSCQYAFGVINKQSGRMIGAATFGIPKDAAHKSEGLLELKRVGWQVGVHVENGISMILKKVQQDLGQRYSGVLAYSDNDLGNGSEYKNSGFTLIGESGPQLTFINPAHPRDTYDSIVATKQSAENGVIAKRLQPMNITDQEAAQIVEEQLPWRIGKGHGYASQYDTGSKTWIKKW